MPNMSLKTLSDRDRLLEIKNLVTTWFTEPSKEIIIHDVVSAYDVLGKIKELVEDV